MTTTDHLCVNSILWNVSEEFYVCWWRQKLICMLVKYVGEKFSVCWWKELYVSEKFEQKIKCMLVKYVSEKFYVCWWKVPSRKNISFLQHPFVRMIILQMTECQKGKKLHFWSVENKKQILLIEQEGENFWQMFWVTTFILLLCLFCVSEHQNISGWWLD